MTTYTIEATKTIYLRTTVTADSMEEATAIADELIVSDFQQLNTDFIYTFIGKDFEPVTMTECPNHGGNFDCNPFCPVCEGNQEYDKKEN